MFNLFKKKTNKEDCCNIKIIEVKEKDSCCSQSDKIEIDQKENNTKENN